MATKNISQETSDKVGERTLQDKFIEQCLQNAIDKLAGVRKFSSKSRVTKIYGFDSCPSLRMPGELRKEDPAP